MSLFKKVWKELKRGARKFVRIASPGNAILIDVFKGEDPVEAAKKIVIESVGALEDVVEPIAEIEHQLGVATNKLAEKVGGDLAKRLVGDLMRVATINPMGPGDVRARLFGLKRFIETGDLEHLNPFAPIVSWEIRTLRDQYWDKARPLPASFLEKLPNGLKSYGEKARYIRVSEINNLSLPQFAITHLNRASKVVCIDLIVTKDANFGSKFYDHYWLHEVVHVKQYAEMGLDNFVARYLSELLESGINELEEQADLIACSRFPVPKPGYLGKPCDKWVAPPRTPSRRFNPNEGKILP